MIRKAKKTDAKAIAPLLYNALHEIAEKITGAKTKADVLTGLETWFSKKENRLSYENCFVEEQDGQAVGIIVAYHGSHAKQLDTPIVKHLRRIHQDSSITLEKEAELRARGWSGPLIFHRKPWSCTKYTFHEAMNRNILNTNLT